MNIDKQKLRLTRREFLGFTWAASLIGLVGQAGAALVQFIMPRIVPGSFGSKVIAGRADEFQPGSVSHVQKGRFYISHLPEGGMLALWHRCTHLGCTVPWREAESIFHCPCHNSIFNAKGEVLSGPAPRPLDLFPIEIQEGKILVDTGSPIERDKFDPAQATRG